MAEPLPPGRVIGILGGGQLGRMLAAAAQRLDLVCHIYDPSAACPAGDIAHSVTSGAWDDTGALARFAAACDVVTFEFENVPATSLDAVEAACPVFPPRGALAVSQDRLSEKDLLTGIGLKTADYVPVASLQDLQDALATIGTPSILKTRRLGYDGKGQARLTSPDDAATAWNAMAGADALLEGFVDFQREISVIATRGQDHRIIAFEPGENVHRDGILHTTTVPAKIAEATRAEAIAQTKSLMQVLDYVGTIGVEFFVTSDGLIINEFAPRVHNSGHWTQNGGTPCQFEAHIRAIAGWPLPDPLRTADVVMENLIGSDVDRAEVLAAEPGAFVHLYGKAETRPGRKMGHVNRVNPR
ncbi:MAG: 5-(carboxyamino)imidazole ribonucleotide synthase [Pseudomonadota bacterium]